MTPAQMTEVKPTYLTTNAVFIGRSIRLSLRNTEALVMAIVLPVMLMLMFTYVFGGAIDPGGDYVVYVVPGIILLCAGFGSSSTAVSVAEDMTNGIIDRFRTMPIHSVSVITGHIVASLARNLVATGIVIGVGHLVGYRSSASAGEWLAALGVITLFILAFTVLFAAIGLSSGNPSAASGYGFALLFLPYLSSAFVPTETMPTWLRGVAEHQPITPVIETIRGLLNGTPIHNNGWLALAWCLGLLAIAFIWCNLVFKRKAGRR
ncbi:ABC transporter permease [Paenibacillus sp. OV219]|uniref:ABC transporter permease n=1 Tax=Paenibacillus sp. OV219 TaxID=1884377 RepID=UPI0008B6253F|nr:ABC transporter permease [Paenibacillus sp. OV219]SEO52473.1 ABC-2 type transport system permease protein [Paenibacillus sp. OV219]